MAKSRHILLVDDDEDDRSFFREAVAELSLASHFSEAIDGQDALDLLQGMSNLPDYIFLDLNMPRMDGKSLLSTLKNAGDLKHIPVIIFSTSSDQNDRNDSLRLGACSFITKPYGFAELCNAIKSVVDPYYLRVD